MFFFFIVGTHFFVWGSAPTTQQMHCGRCGTVAPFTIKKGMNFITVFFIVPVIPISGVKNIVQCPNCGARYEAAPELLAAQNSGGPQFR
jgi:ribosomal protein S27AE